MPPRPTAPTLPVLPYRKPTRGRDYWLLDDVLPDPGAVRERCLARNDWTEGYPHKPESWPGLRTMPALEPGELAHVEKLVSAPPQPAAALLREPDSHGHRLLRHHAGGEADDGGLLLEGLTRPRRPAGGIGPVPRALFGVLPLRKSVLAGH